MTTNDLRKKYLDFFQSKGHVIVPSSLLVPENDPTTLFTGSGMQPMLPYFLGEKHPAGTRVADSQKCFRTQDIEEVGDNRHTTNFEMLGNWSFGDYFKQEQISWMWQFLTEELAIDPKRLYFTCFRGNDELKIPRDTESALKWQELFLTVGIEAAIGEDPERNGIQEGERIFYYSEKKNWWSRAGVPNNMPVGEPGGPDTEMFFDFRPDLGRACIPDTPFSGEFCHVNCDCGRFMEIGNNVFMQYRKTDQGFEELAQMNVDFGGGLERLLAATNDVPDIFLLDLFDSAKQELERISGISYGSDEKNTYAMRVILDHLKAALFLIGDGVLPSNKDQGYFVRRLIRRAVRYGNVLGIKQSFTVTIAHTFISVYAEQYPNLQADEKKILVALEEEEEKFHQTLTRGLKELEKFLDSPEGHWTRQGKDNIEQAPVYTNDRIVDIIFDLYQTYGFPLEQVFEEFRERGIKIDEGKLGELFNIRFEKHQDLSRTASAGKFKGGLADHSAKVTALHTTTHLMLAGLRKELGEGVHQAGSNITEERTRFDFTHGEKVSREILDRVENYVNSAIASQATVTTAIMDKIAAKEAGVEGSFWEKYPEKVTVYRVMAPDGTIYSQELCGGPHVVTTADIASFGTFKITKEEASSAGVRRIKAVLQ